MPGGQGGKPPELPEFTRKQLSLAFYCKPFTEGERASSSNYVPYVYLGADPGPEHSWILSAFPGTWV